MQVQLALSLYDRTGKNRLYDGLQTVGKSPGGMHQLQLSDDMKARAGLMPGGTIGWLDCNRPQPDCTAQLLVRDVDPDKCLVMRLIPVTTTTRFREEYPSQIRITPALPNSTAIPPKLLSLSGFGSERELRFVVRFADNNPVLEYGTGCSSP
ncbi:MAG: hypothetical protein IPK81_06095 [Rhodospirillales bacterium]|nr:MAG: hypothetical protein IPK81_06095 [Rhodospirillales bacterium]